MADLGVIHQLLRGAVGELHNRVVRGSQLGHEDPHINHLADHTIHFQHVPPA